jgi:SAM-dependent methyltransferase
LRPQKNITQYVTGEKMEVSGKPILDACCGGRMFWFNKNNPQVLYVDNRQIAEELPNGKVFRVSPDVVCDFRFLPFSDKTFKHVVFDPPQMLYTGRGGQMELHYTRLPKDWKPLIREGFAECWRVLDDYGTLIFKWSEKDILLKKVLEVIGHEPLYGHRTGNRTIWLCFVKTI